MHWPQGGLKLLLVCGTDHWVQEVLSGHSFDDKPDCDAEKHEWYDGFNDPLHTGVRGLSDILLLHKQDF